MIILRESDIAIILTNLHANILPQVFRVWTWCAIAIFNNFTILGVIILHLADQISHTCKDVENGIRKWLNSNMDLPSFLTDESKLILNLFVSFFLFIGAGVILLLSDFI